MAEAEDAFDGSFSGGNDMDAVIKAIYEMCDEDGQDSVQVSKLVYFIKPYMEADVSALEKLKDLLDPNDSDPAVSSILFFNVMSSWAKDFNHEDSFHNISPKYVDKPPLVESTPRKSFGHRQMRVYAEAAALNVSAVEKTSFLGTDSSESGMNKSVMEDQLKQLAHQSKKFNDELVLARSQLNGQEEQNIVLQNEIDKLTKDLKHEREINETLLRENKTLEDMRDRSYNKQKLIDKLKKDFMLLEKENGNLQAQISDLDRERQKAEEKMSRIHEKLTEARDEAIELRAEIDMKEEQLNLSEGVKKDLLGKISDLKDQNDNLKEANNCLKVEKEKISKLLQGSLKVQSQTMLNFTPQKSSNSSPPAMYVVERSGCRKKDQGQEQGDKLHDESVTDEDLLHAAFSSVATAQASLMDEFQAIRDTSPTTLSSYGSDKSCSNCNANEEVKRRLDDLCEQIDWLKTENVTLKQSKDQLVQIFESKQSLEDSLKRKDQTIEELKRDLESARSTSGEFAKKCEEMKGELSRLESVFREQAKVLESLDDEKEKLSKASSVDQQLIDRLNGDVRMLEASKKRLEMKVENVLAEKEKLVEEHKIHVEEYAKQIVQYKEDITQLEEKFYAAHKDASNNYAKLYLQHEKLVDLHQELNAEHSFFMKTINETSSKDLSPRQKLQHLIKTKENYSKLEIRLEKIIEEKKNETLTLHAKVAELEKKCLQGQSNPTARAKTPHDRAQIKLEKLREKVDHLDDQLKKERAAHSALKRESQEHQRLHESLMKEKLVIIQETEESQRNLLAQKNVNSELCHELRRLVSSATRVRQNMLKFSKNWRAVFDRVESIDVLLRHLGETAIDELCSQMSAFGSPANIPDAFAVDRKEIGQAENDLQTVSLILDALSGWNAEQLLGDVGDKKEIKVLKSYSHLSRPMSPDSPNLGALEEVTSISASGDNTMRFFSDRSIEMSNEESEDEFDDNSQHFDDLRAIYQSADLGFLMTSVSAERPDEEDTRALRKFVDEFVLTFMVDCTGFKNRLLGQFETLQEVMSRLVGHLRTFTLPGSGRKQRKQAMVGVVRSVVDLTRSAERYGAIQQEVQSSQAINRLITHITSLRQLGDGKAEGNLRKEVVYVDSISDAGSDRRQASRTPMTMLLDTMRPANVVRLVCALALAYLTYYFSQRFVFPIAATYSRRGGHGGARRDALCWASWLDFLAACLGRVQSDGPPPV